MYYAVLFIVANAVSFFLGRTYGEELEARTVAAALKLYSNALADLKGVEVAALARVKKYL
jgi:hypothetical protein